MTACPLPAVHTIAHLFNLERYNGSQQAMDSSLPAVLSKMHLQGSNKWLNPIHSNQTVSVTLVSSSPSPPAPTSLTHPAVPIDRRVRGLHHHPGADGGHHHAGAHPHGHVLH